MNRMRRLHDSVMDTCRSWEGHWDDPTLLRTFRLPKPPSGRLSIDFSKDSCETSDHNLSKETGNESQV